MEAIFGRNVRFLGGVGVYLYGFFVCLRYKL